MFKNEDDVLENNGIYHIYKNGKPKKYKSWLLGAFSFLYDPIMNKSVFPKTLGASMEKHELFLKNELKFTHNKEILELGTGSGNLSQILPNDNQYSGIDISEGLLKIARKKFYKAGFKNFKLFLCSAEELPFKNNFYDICICNISLNFFNDLDSVISELRRTLKKKSKFICSVPIKDRNTDKKTIRGNIYSENELKDIFESKGFLFKPYPFKNGSLLYFSAVLEN
ncbi:class I SAM-dependent methyltransferase [Methanococcus maripaludis]|uniref:SAM-dependent methyltransferase n=1 Tax=Methanococcus maripaludis TaxID=39152 RepID=A0A7J9SDA0_METMI|nr:class I SAM-dependent methyltransferase [Methanococcus maripaludis]MBA2864326.1 SAM-dependent methyltransferase [Methanococcus maripaludis]MBB6497252.1 SAM-dependent methyltransferase [Methanococcus maripaludis]